MLTALTAHARIQYAAQFSETLCVKIQICIFQGHVVIYSACYGKYVVKYPQTDAETYEPEAAEMRCKNPRSGITEKLKRRAQEVGYSLTNCQRDRKETR